MSDEEIYQRISELEKQLAELRGKLPSAPDWKGPRIGTEGSLENQVKGEPFRIRSDEELDLTPLLPDLARQIFDALPVQIFIKKPDIVAEDLGRPYIYLNQKAREIKHWKRSDVIGKHDRDIHANDAEGTKLFQKMVAQESITLRKDREKHDWESRLTETEWNEVKGTWSRNRNIEIPILDQQGTRVIGFCSVANNLVFLELPREWAHYQSCAQHHVVNLYKAIDGWLSKAIRELNTIPTEQFTDEQAKKARDVALDRISKCRERVMVHRASSDFQIKALNSSIGTAPEVGTIPEIVKALQDAYKQCGFALNISYAGDENQIVQIFQPKVVTAILSVFIANAVVRGPGDSEQMIDRIDVTAECNMVSNQVNWTVSNKCDGEATPNDNYFIHWSVDGPLDTGFDRRLLMNLISSFFPGSKADEMISFSKPEVTMWSSRFVGPTKVHTNDNV